MSRVDAAMSETTISNQAGKANRRMDMNESDAVRCRNCFRSKEAQSRPAGHKASIFENRLTKKKIGTTKARVSPSVFGAMNSISPRSSLVSSRGAGCRSAGNTISPSLIS